MSAAILQSELFASICESPLVKALGLDELCFIASYTLNDFHAKLEKKQIQTDDVRSRMRAISQRNFSSQIY